MSEHTPGPWAVDDSGIRIEAKSPDGSVMPLAAAKEYGFGTRRAEANARLIAAAPELLGALEGVALGGMHTHPDGHLVVLTAESWDRVRAAIAKAREPAP